MPIVPLITTILPTPKISYLNVPMMVPLTSMGSPTHERTQNFGPENKYQTSAVYPKAIFRWQLSFDKTQRRVNHIVMSSVTSTCGFSKWGASGPARLGHFPLRQVQS